MKRLFKSLAFWSFALSLTATYANISHAQTKRAKSKRAAAVKRASKVLISEKDNVNAECEACLASFNLPRPAVNRPSAKTPDGRIYSDCEPLNLQVKFQPKPIYPLAAIAVRAEGTVAVDVVIDEDGKVIWAKIRYGHPLLRLAALRAACQMRIEPVIDCLKRRLKSNAILYYTFKAQ